MKGKFFEGVITAELFFRGARTLKDRRALARSVADRLRNMGFSVARIDDEGDVRRSRFAAVCVTSVESAAQGMLQKASGMLESPEWEQISHSSAVMEIRDEQD
ncbi:DUF503 family protein [Candidatus Fermentibacterales bacterium]|nr:DUF503 family protein [Candidatus Fermentibacterales bacterium]